MSEGVRFRHVCVPFGLIWEVNWDVFFFFFPTTKVWKKTLFVFSCSKRKSDEVDGVSKKQKKEEEAEKKKLEEQLKVPFLFILFVLCFLEYVLRLDIICFYVSTESEPADLGNQGQAQKVLFDQRHEGAANSKWPERSLRRVQCKRNSPPFFLLLITTVLSIKESFKKPRSVLF